MGDAKALCYCLPPPPSKKSSEGGGGKRRAFLCFLVSWNWKVLMTLERGRRDGGGEIVCWLCFCINMREWESCRSGSVGIHSDGEGENLFFMLLVVLID